MTATKSVLMRPHFAMPLTITNSLALILCTKFLNFNDLLHTALKHFRKSVIANRKIFKKNFGIISFALASEILKLSTSSYILTFCPPTWFLDRFDNMVAVFTSRLLFIKIFSCRFYYTSFYKNTRLIFCSKFKNNSSLSKRTKSQSYCLLNKL